MRILLTLYRQIANKNIMNIEVFRFSPRFQPWDREYLSIETVSTVYNHWNDGKYIIPLKRLYILILSLLTTKVVG